MCVGPSHTNIVITPVAHSRKRNVTVYRPTVCPVGILAVIHQVAACDAASVHFGQTIRRIDIIVKTAEAGFCCRNSSRCRMLLPD